MEVVLTDYETTAILEEQTVLLQRGGLQCDARREYCKDPLVGEAVWEIKEPGKCTGKEFDIIYKGNVEIVTFRNRGEINNILTIDNGERITALKLGKRQFLCGQSGWATDHARLVVMMENEYGGFPFSGLQGVKYVKNLDFALYVNTKFLFVAHSLRMDMENLVHEMMVAQCLQRKEIYENRLRIVQNHPELSGLLTGETQGSFGRIMGEVVNIVKCVPVPVNPRSDRDCWQELPVFYNRKPVFLMPVTRIITSHGTKVECVPALISRFKLQGTWWGRNPGLVRTLNPTELNPNKPSMDVEFRDLFDVGNRGLYSEGELIKLQKEMLFPVVRKAYTDNTFRQMQNSDGSASILNLLTEKEFSKLSDNVGRRVSWFFNLFGHYAAILIGMIILIKIIIYLMSVVINCCSIKRQDHQDRQWYHYGAAFLTSLTHWLAMGAIVPKQTRKQDKMKRCSAVNDLTVFDGTNEGNPQELLIKDPSAPYHQPYERARELMTTCGKGDEMKVIATSNDM